MEKLHSKGFVINKLTPSKLLISLNLNYVNLFLSDYKYAKSFKNIDRLGLDLKLGVFQRHILTKFSSLNCHLGISKKKSFKNLIIII